MQGTLRNDFRVEVKWVEAAAKNTLENAYFTRDMLSAAGVSRVYLVTHAWHMRRAAWAFENYGLGVTPAPTGFSTLGPEHATALGYLPTARGLWMSSLAIHERLGYLWYTNRSKPVPAPAP
jgi:uncharacterized SAM-binding protein YcdF (DUF218 family)